MTLVLLALDGLDAGLVERFDADAYALEANGDLETFSYSMDDPYTLEVWPTVATGLHPREHGVTGSNVSDWDNPVLELGSKLTAHMSYGWRRRLGDLAQRFLDAEYGIPETEADSIFDGEDRVVQNWPGVTNSEELQAVWAMTDRGYSQPVFEREVFGKAAAQFGWAREMLEHDVSLAAVHVHALDVFGHAYCHADDEADLARTYERIGSFVDELREAMGPEDDLLLLSDHGIRVDAFDEPDDVGGHSPRAYVAGTFDEVPGSVYDVRAFVEARLDRVSVDREALEMPEDRLRDLGYIE